MAKDQLSETMMKYLGDAEALAAQQGVRLTTLRKMILALLLEANAPVKAYELIEKMREQGHSITPTTTYRILDFLLSEKLIHKIHTLNAYISCTVDHQHEHNSLMVICSQCQKAEEIDDETLTDTICDKLDDMGMSLQDHCIEIQGICKDCKD